METDTKPTIEPPQTSPKKKKKKRTAVIFQEACSLHRYTRTSDSSSIVERPERLRALKAGVSAAWARLESRSIANGSASRHEFPSPPPPPAVASTEGGLKEKEKEKVEGEGEATTELEKMMRGLGINSSSSSTVTAGGGGGGGGRGKAKRKDPQQILGGPFDCLLSTRTLSPSSPTLLYVHPLPNSPPPPDYPTSTHSSPLSANQTPWPTQLQSLCRNSTKNQQTAPRHSEIPEHLPQGDLYLTEESESAIFGALGAVCEAVDRVVEGTTEGAMEGYDRAFVAVRPPGHHCGESNPMGFCFLNNVVVAAAHAHKAHGIHRIIIVDIDLHHGNGTQELVWRINSSADEVHRAYASLVASHSNSSPRKFSPSKPKPPLPPTPTPLSIFYSSLHDLYSYPCEDGDPGLIQAASLNIGGGHSQWISNVHLDSWESEDDFYQRLYPRYLQGLLGTAEEFCKKTSGTDEKTLVLISAGFDASEHESAGMSRHRRNVPTSFYHRFAQDATKFSSVFTKGKIISILEGGYSDRALISSSLSYLSGYVESDEKDEDRSKDKEWWEKDCLSKIEKATKASNLSRGVKLGAGGGEVESWVQRTVEVFGIIEGCAVNGGGEKKVAAASGAAVGGPAMQLRERKPRVVSNASTPNPSPTKTNTNHGPPLPALPFTSQPIPQPQPPQPHLPPPVAQPPPVPSNTLPQPFPSNPLPPLPTLTQPHPSSNTLPQPPPHPPAPQPPVVPFVPHLPPMIRQPSYSDSPSPADSTTTGTASSDEYRTAEDVVSDDNSGTTAPKIKITWRAGGI